MIKLVFLFLFITFPQANNKWVNSVWTQEISKGYYNVLKLKKGDKATRYDCELDYTLQCTYKVVNDTLFVTEKDDSHTEDGGKVSFLRNQYIIRDRSLFLISSGELVKGKWIDNKIALTKALKWPNWQRANL